MPEGRSVGQGRQDLTMCSVTVESEVLEIAPSRLKLDRGMVTLRSETQNQRGEIVQILRATLVVHVVRRGLGKRRSIFRGVPLDEIATP